MQLLSTTTNDTQIKVTQQLKEMKFINKTFEEFEACRRDKKQEIDECNV